MRWNTAVVTGASSGIGRAMAQLLASYGVDLVVVARSEGELHDLAAQLRERHGVAVEVEVADLTVDRDVERVAQRLRSDDRPVDLLVNNAGTGSVGPLSDLDVRREEQIVRLHALAVLHLTGVAAKTMQARRGGTILNVASLAAYAPIPYFAVYSATKSFVLALSLALREELRGSGVSVTALCPGFVDTGFPEKAGVRNPPFRRMYADVGDVARRGLAGAARGRAVVLPGPAVRVAAAFARLGPHVLWSRLMGAVSRSVATAMISQAARNANSDPDGPPPDEVSHLGERDESEVKS